jgi:DNA-binding IclR family transcriptional regulator
VLTAFSDVAPTDTAMAVAPTGAAATGTVAGLAASGGSEAGPERRGRSVSTSTEPEIQAALRDGYVARVDSLQPGITDIAFPVLRSDGRAIAALTVPYIATSFSGSQESEVVRMLGEATREIAESLNI